MVSNCIRGVKRIVYFLQKPGKRDSTEVALQVLMQLLAPHHEAGPAATAEFITADQKVLAGEHLGQTAWGQYGGLQQICHKEQINNPGCLCG